MAKNKNTNELSVKSVMEMNDTEFITNADILASPYYRAYVNAKMRAEVYAERERKAAKPVAVPEKGQRSKKRGFFLFLILLFSIVLIAMAVLQFVNIDAVAPYAGIYNVPAEEGEEAGHIMLLDPAIGLVKKFMPSLGMESKFYDLVIKDMPADAAVTTTIGMYAAPVAAALIVILAVIGLIKSLVALFKGKRNGFYKKFRFGLLGIIMLICGIVLVVGGMFSVGLEIGAIGAFFGGTAANLVAAYGLYATLALPILIIICSALSYKK